MEAELKRVKINRENISSFVPIENQRLTRKTHIARLQKAMRNGEYVYTEPIYVNKVGNIYRIIDGNHRIQAISEILRKSKSRKAFVEVTLAVYQGIGKGKEKEVYDRIAKQLSQSVNDLLNLHKDEFYLWQMLNKRSFPVKTTIYGSKTGLPLKMYLHMLFASNRKSNKLAMQGANREELLDVGRKTGMEDFERLREFFDLFVATFGYANANNRYCRPNFLIPLFHIWATNQDLKAPKTEAGQTKNTLGYGRKMFWMKQFEKLVGDTRVIELCVSQSSREVRQRCRDLIIEILNDNPAAKATLSGKHVWKYKRVI